MMTEYCIGQPSDREDIIDFINMVFSQDSVPHDFKTLLTKAYSDDVDTSSCHYLAKEDGRIRAAVGVFPTEMKVGSRTLKIGHIGSVSVHGYSRGKGYMKALMNWAVKDSRDKGYDALVLGGLKNRYQYFGFQPTETVLHYSFAEENVRHGFKDVDDTAIHFQKVTSSEDSYIRSMRRLHESQPAYFDRQDDASFYRFLQSWRSEIYAILKDDTFIGYCSTPSDGSCFREIFLEIPEDFPAVLKAWFAYKNCSYLSVSCAVYETEKNEILGKYCEGYSIGTGHSWNILNFANVAKAFMEVKNNYEPLESGKLALELEPLGELLPGETCCLSCGDSEPASVSAHSDSSSDDSDDEHRTVKRLDAVEGLFSSLALYRNYGTANGMQYKNWFPLPLYLSELDAF